LAHKITAERVWRAWLIFASVSFYMLMAPFGYAFFALLARIPTRAPDKRAASLQALVWRAFSLFHAWMRWLRVLDYEPRLLRAQLPASGSFVVVANHPTLTDTTAILASVPRLCTAVRTDVFRKAWLKPLLSASQHFDAGEANPLGAEVMIEAAVRRLNQGFRVLIFPEGTRSPRRGMRRFGRAVFEAACRANVPIVAVYIEEEPAWLAKGGYSLFGPPAVLPVKRAELLGIFDPANFSRDSKRIRDYIEARYRERLMPARTLSAKLESQGQAQCAESSDSLPPA
jgi:1-acyl-sn-glycerol-3-phosphate acyltransferase